MARTVAITGGGGFVGLALAEAFRAQGDTVLLLDISPPDPLLFGRRELSGCAHVAADILDPEGLRARLREAAVDLLVHAAALTPDLATAQSQALRVAQVNVTGTLNTLEAAAAAGLRDVILLSSISVYGSAGQPGLPALLESAPVQPDSLYGETKWAAERLSARIAPGLGLRLATCRLGPLFGPWESPRDTRADLSPHAQLRALAARGQAARLAHDMRGDYVYSRDAAAMIAALADRMDAAAGGCFNIGGGAPFTLADWATAAGLPAPLIDPSAPDIAPRADPRRAPMSIAAIAELTGLAGNRPLAAAVADEQRWIAGLPARAGEAVQ